MRTNSLSAYILQASLYSFALVENGTNCRYNDVRRYRTFCILRSLLRCRRCSRLMNCLSIRHSTRNFPNREGSKIDKRSDCVGCSYGRSFNRRNSSKQRLPYLQRQQILMLNLQSLSISSTSAVYENRCISWASARQTARVELKVRSEYYRLACNESLLPDNLLLKVVSLITDPVTTTDELIPSGETSSYRSNPLKSC